MSVATWLGRAARARKDATAVALGRSRYQSFQELAGRAARLGYSLRRRLGLAPGARVALCMKNVPEYFEVQWACYWAGLVAVPANAKLHGREFAYILENSEASVVFTTPDLSETIEAHRPDCVAHIFEVGTKDYGALFGEDLLARETVEPDDLAWLFYTSGTTGRPKGAMITHRNLQAMTWGYLSDIEWVNPGEQILHAAPLSHGSGMYMFPHICRMGVNIVPESGGFDPAEIADLAKHWGAVSLFAAPTMVKRLTYHPGDMDPSGFRTITYGGAPMYVEDAVAAVERFGSHFAQLFGQGESPMTGTILSKQEIGDKTHPNWRARLATIGIANSTVDCTIANDAGERLPPGEVGEVVIRGDSVVPGYWRAPEATAKALRNGFLYTGDMGSIDAEGYITLKDRSKDVIISGGSNIYPREVEEVLLQHPQIGEVSVIGRPDKEWGENVIAYVARPEAGADDAALARELDALCLSSIARFKRPKDYVFLEALPKSNYGKILKTELRAIDAKQGED